MKGDGGRRRDGEKRRGGDMERRRGGSGDSEGDCGRRTGEGMRASRTGGRDSVLIGARSRLRRRGSRLSGVAFRGGGGGGGGGFSPCDRRSLDFDDLDRRPSP